MSRRYILERLHLNLYPSIRRKFLRLNEGEYEPHRIRPYAFSSSKIRYRNMFEKKNSTRLETINARRSTKKSIRRELYSQIFEDDSMYFL